MKRPIDGPVFDSMVRLRRDLHRHPELSWEEHWTADRLTEALEDIGIGSQRIAGTGLIADIEPADPDAARLPRIALRADMDGLPIHEETGLPFASENPGVMHACGHDGHMSMLITAARLLTESPAPVPVRLIFQPAEETGSGAIRMMEAGVLEEVAAIFGGHVDRHFPTGMIIVSDGIVNASTDAFRVHIRGQEAHAARPHEAIDAVLVGSLIVMAIQTIVSREIDPSHPSVISVGRFDAGTTHNVIAGRAVLEGTIRAQEADVREHLMRSVRRIVESVGKLHEADIELELEQGTPALVNDEGMAALGRKAAADVAGSEHVRSRLRGANMGGEDFAWYLERVRGCYVRFGARVPGREGYPAHSSGFEFDEEALAYGAAWFHRIALDAGSRLAGGTL
jgi:hippurate hydrolase